MLSGFAGALKVLKLENSTFKTVKAMKSIIMELSPGTSLKNF